MTCSTTAPLGWRAWLIAAALLAPAAAAADATGGSCPPVATLPGAQQMNAAMEGATNRGFLWRVRRDGHSSYLYGTLHVARFEWMFPGASVLSALQAVDTVALELDLLDPDVQSQLQRGMRASSDPLPPALAQRLQERARQECLPEQSLAGADPELQIDLLTALAGRRDGLDPAYGIDAYLAGWAHAARKSVVSLETPELQLQTLHMGSPAETANYVQSALLELESGTTRRALLRLAQVWADSDLPTLDDYASWCDCLRTDSDRADMKRLLDDRNPGLARAIESLHAGGHQVFAAVGSLHMIGAGGLPALLARRGFSVEQLQP